MAGVTPIYGFPFQELGDPPHGPNLGADLASAVETEIQRVDVDVSTHETRLDAAETMLGDGETFVGTASGNFSGDVEIRRGANGVVVAFGNLDVDVDTGGGWVATGIVIPSSLWPKAVTAGATNEIVQTSAYYNSTFQFRYRVTNTGALEFQHTGADGTFETVSCAWFV